MGGRSRLSSPTASSRSGKRKKVSDWARRCWARRVGVSEICSRSSRRGVYGPAGMEFPANLRSMVLISVLRENDERFLFL